MIPKKLRETLKLEEDTLVILEEAEEYLVLTPVHKKTGNVAEKILSKIEEKRLDVAIDTEILQEILYRYNHLNLKEQGTELAWNTLDLVSEVFNVTRKDAETALHYYKKYTRITPRDAIHIATMVNHELEEIISTDKHFEAVEEVKRIDPLRLV